VSEIETIASVDGVDGIFIGPSDLAADCGHLGNRQYPEVQSIIADACTRIRANGKAAGILTADPGETADYLWQGFEFVAVGSDAGVLVKGVRKLAADLSHQIPRLQSAMSRI